MSFLRRITQSLLMGIILFTACALPVAPAQGADPQPTDTIATADAQATIPAMADPQPTDTIATKVYLPTVITPPIPSIFGVAFDRQESPAAFDKLAQAGAKWTRMGFGWAAVEPTPGARNWAAVAAFEQTLKDAAANGYETIVIIDTTPAWALRPGYGCNAVADDQMGRFGDFMYDAVRRYSAAPYQVKYWEFWNEPDVDGFFGCWGRTGQPNFGGEVYGEMLKSVYPRVKSASNTAQVLVGGLLLDCDPRPAPSNATPMPAGKDCAPSKFLNGILQAGAGNSFDGISFHAFDAFIRPNAAHPQGSYGNINWYSNQYTTGTIGLVKARFLEEELRNAGVSGKYLINTENAVFNYAEVNSPEYIAMKSQYIVQSYATGIAEGWKANLWWSAFGGHHSELVDASLNALPAYQTYAFISQKLTNAVYVQDVAQAGIHGYVFRANNRPMWVLWSATGAPVNVTLGSPTAIYHIDANGNGVMEPLAASISVNEQVRIVEFAP